MIEMRKGDSSEKKKEIPCLSSKAACDIENLTMYAWGATFIHIALSLALVTIQQNLNKERFISGYKFWSSTCYCLLSEFPGSYSIYSSIYSAQSLLAPFSDKHQKKWFHVTYPQSSFREGNFKNSARVVAKSSPVSTRIL